MSNDDSLERTYNDRLRERLEDMNTPTPRTDAEEKYFNSNKLKRTTELQSIYNFARQLEQELSEARKESAYHQQAYDTASAERDTLKRERDEARTRGDTYGHKYAACILEREKLKVELKQMSVCLDASNDARAMIGIERDQLRKVVDELANHIEGTVEIESGYSQLPHVIEQRKSK